MATLIAANYQSESSTAYGFMSTSGIKLKNSTTYTLKCRYKWNKNGTSSTYPMACYLYESTWSYGNNNVNFTSTPSHYTTVMWKFTTSSNASSYSYSISNYANGQRNSGVADGAILDVDWYELWEGDATQFSLTDAIALSEKKSEDDFLAIQSGCTNKGYFSTAEPINALRSWMGYYYISATTTSYSEWSYSYNHYTSASRSRTVTTYNVYSNGKVQASSNTQTEAASVSYGSWSYNWTTSNKSTRSRTVTYSWSDYSSSATQSETGGTRYLTTSGEKYLNDAYGQVVHTFPANGSGSKALYIYSYDYWSGTYIQSVAMTGVTVSCAGFTCKVNGSTVTITASNLGTTETAYKKSTIVSSKSGFETRYCYASIAQEANVVTSYDNPVVTSFTYPSIDWNVLTATPSTTVTQVKRYSSSASASTTVSAYTKTFTHNNSGSSAASLNGSSGLVTFSSKNETYNSSTKAPISRTKYVDLVVTANGKSSSKYTAGCTQKAFPASVNAYQVINGSSTTSGGGTIGVGSYAYFYATVSIPAGSTASMYYWEPQKNSGRGSSGFLNGSYCRYSMYNDGAYPSDTITCRITFPNGIQVKDTVYVSLVQGSSGGGTGGGDSSDSSSWSLRRNVSNSEDIENENINNITEGGNNINDINENPIDENVEEIICNDSNIELNNQNNSSDLTNEQDS